MSSTSGTPRYISIKLHTEQQHWAVGCFVSAILVIKLGNAFQFLANQTAGTLTSCQISESGYNGLE